MWHIWCQFSNLGCLGGSPLYNLNIFFTEEATGQQVVQDTLNAPHLGHQHLSVAREQV